MKAFNKCGMIFEAIIEDFCNKLILVAFQSKVLLDNTLSLHLFTFIHNMAASKFRPIRVTGIVFGRIFFFKLEIFLKINFSHENIAILCFPSYKVFEILGRKSRKQ